MSDSLSPAMGRPVNHDARAERRRQIVDAARRCALRSGFHAASMSSISTEAKVNVATIYQYFENKDAVIEAVVELSVHADLSILETFEPSSLDMISMRELVESTLLSDEGLKIAALRSEILSEANRNPKIAKAVKAGTERTIVALEKFIRRFQKRGDLPDYIDAKSASQDIAYNHEGIHLHIPFAGDRKSDLVDLHLAFLKVRLGIPDSKSN